MRIPVVNLGARAASGNSTHPTQSSPAPAGDPTLAKIGRLVEAAIITNDAAFWPTLATLEELDVEVIGRLPARKREVQRAKLNRIREALLFDRELLAATIVLDVERELAAAQIIRGSRP